MFSAETFCLHWNKFDSNKSAFPELMKESQIFNVTLVFDDDQIQAHIVIISACSPFLVAFSGTTDMSTPVPFLYLKSIKHKYLRSILDFMYHGEVSVEKEELTLSYR